MRAEVWKFRNDQSPGDDQGTRRFAFFAGCGIRRDSSQQGSLPPPAGVPRRRGNLFVLRAGTGAASSSMRPRHPSFSSSSVTVIGLSLSSLTST
jgi:hypothetical protein